MSAVRTRRTLDITGADAVMAAAEDEALRNGRRVVIAIVDAWGHLLQLRRTKGAQGETPNQDESVSLAGARAPFSFIEVPALTYSGARAAAEAAAAAAAVRGVWPVAAVVDAGGELMYLWRPDLAQVASVGVATDKARTAALYRRPSKDFEDQAAHGRPSALHLAEAVPLQGGVPVVHRGYVIAAVGVSGASSADEDNELARLAADAAAAAAQDGERDDGPGMPPGPARR